jgi:hypothetical protein
MQIIQRNLPETLLGYTLKLKKNTAVQVDIKNRNTIQHPCYLQGKMQPADVFYQQQAELELNQFCL